MGLVLQSTNNLFLCECVSECKIECYTDSRRYCDKYHRAPLQPLLRREKNEAEEDRLPGEKIRGTAGRLKLFEVEQGHGDDIHSRSGDQRDRGGAQPVKGVLDDGAFMKVVQQVRDQQYHDYRRQHEPRRRDGRSGYPRAHISGEGRHVYPDRPWGGFRDGDHIRDVGRREPAAPGGERIEEWQRRQAAADGEEADLEKFIEEPQQEGHLLPPILRRHAIPKRSEARTMSAGLTEKGI